MTQPVAEELIAAAMAHREFCHPAFEDGTLTAAQLRDVAHRLGLSKGELSILGIFFEKITISPDPKMALNNLQRFVEATANPEGVRIALKRSPENIQTLVTLFSGSQFLSDVLIAQPEAFSWIATHETLYGRRATDYYRQGAAEAVAGITDRGAQRLALGRWRRREYLRIGCRDLLQIADAEEISRDISDLAQAIVDQAAQLILSDLIRRFGCPVAEDGVELLTDADAGPRPPDTATTSGAACDVARSCGMCILGMGKLGGRELNFSSDIDLIFIYEAEGQTTGRLDGNRRIAVISNHDFFTRMGEALIKFLSERGPDGMLFRVDMRLRPEGADGPLVRSFEALGHYLNAQARDWERLAYLKARVVSGPARLAEKIYRIIADFVFAGQDPGRVVEEVQDLKIRIDREVINSDLYHRDVKRGYGGIREIEFAIAAMQIIHGFRHHALRVRNTFLAIQRLRETHIIDESAAAFYQYAYSFLRMIEHRLQMAQEAQTHTLPAAGDGFEAMARRCGFASGNDFLLEYERVTMAVHARFVAFFQNDTALVEEAARDVLTILDRAAPEEAALAALARLGIETPGALRLIHALAYGTREVFVTAEGQRFFEQMLPALLRLTVAAPRPEQVLSHLHSFALAIKSITYYYEVISQHPEILKMLATLFGTSDALSVRFIAHPEYFDSLISTRTLDEPDRDGTHRRQRMNATRAMKSAARQLEMLRRVVQFEQIVAALKYLLHIEPLAETLQRLTAIADDAIDLATSLATRRLIGKWLNVDRPADSDIRELTDWIGRSFAVIGLGKFGGRELNFFGDLDLVFVYDGNRELPEMIREHATSSQVFFDAYADALMNVLSEQVKGGRAYAVDARLRPHGISAPLTTEAQTFADYLRNVAGTWELQALTRARTTWGNRELLRDLQVEARTRAAANSSREVALEIAGMRLRMEEATELAPGQIEVKRSAGGLVDVEFIMQYLTLTGQLPWQPDNANYFYAVNNPPAALSQSHAASLRAGYVVLRGVENTIRLVSGSAESAVSAESEAARAVAIALGFGNVENLQNAVRDAKQAIRRVWNSFFAGK